MAIAIGATRQSVATYYGTLGNWLGLATASPGTTTTPANEATGGGYARVQTTWSNGANGVINGTAATITAAAGTYTFAILASAATVAAANMIDNASITSTTLSAAGQVVLTPTYTQS